MNVENLRPAPFCEVVTASDTVNFAEYTRNKTPSRRIRVTSAGSVVLVFPDGRTCVHPALAGEYLDVAAVRINASSTTATGFVVYY